MPVAAGRTERRAADGAGDVKSRPPVVIIQASSLGGGNAAWTALDLGFGVVLPSFGAAVLLALVALLMAHPGAGRL